MRKLYVIGLALVAVLASGVIAASASAAEWLAGGNPIATALASTTTGELELGNSNSLFGLKTAVLCSGVFVGTVGPGAADTITEILSLAGAKVELGKEISCENKENCESPTLAPEKLPWTTKLTSMTTDVLEGGSWSVKCTTVFGPIEETCSSPETISTVENDAVEKDVLGAFKLEETATCTGNNTKTGWTSTEKDSPGLIALSGGEELTVS